MIKIIDNLTYPKPSNDPLGLRAMLWPKMMEEIKERVLRDASEVNTNNEEVILTFRGAVTSPDPEWEVSVECQDKQLEGKIEQAIKNGVD